MLNALCYLHIVFEYVKLQTLDPNPCEVEKGPFAKRTKHEYKLEDPMPYKETLNPQP